MEANQTRVLKRRLKRHEDLERIARASPESLRRRLVLYAVAMLSLPVVFILCCVLVAAGGVWAGYYLVDVDPRMLIISLLAVVGAGIGVYTALNGLTARYSESPRQKLVRADYPELFAFVEDVRRRAGGPPVDAIVIEPILNASVGEDWDSLLSRKPRHTLMIGLDLMELLSLEEFRSTLAHEMGHLAARDTYYSSWVSRVLLCWAHILESGEAGGRQQRLLVKFWSWFHESYGMIRTAVSRQAEIRADHIEATVTSPEVAARALLRLEVYGAALAYHESRALFLRKRSEPIPPADIYTERLDYLRAPLPPEVEAEARRIAGSAATTFEDSHPALRQRLAALGFEDPDKLLLDPVTERATVLLGGRHEALVGQMGQVFRQRIIADWRRVFEAARREAVELAEIKAKAAKGPLEVDSAWRECEIETAMSAREEVIPRLGRFIEEHPDHARGRFLRGLHLLIRCQEEGVADVEFGMSREPSLRPQGFSAIGDFLFRQGRYEEIVRITERVDDFTEDREGAEKEREKLGHGVAMSAHRLTPGRVEAVVRAARTYSRIRCACLVRAETTRMPDEDFHLVVVEVDYVKELDASGVRYHIARELDFPNRVIVVPNDPGRWIERAREVPGSTVYTRES